MITSAELDVLVETYLLSNTPDFLLRRLLEQPTLRAIASRMSAAELLEIVRAADSEEQESAVEAARGYVALAALMSKADKSMLDDLRVWTPTRLRWLPQMVVAWDRMRRPTAVETIGFAQAVPRIDGVKSTNSTSSSTVIFSH